MADPAESENQNLLPVQAFFSVDGEFQTFIGQGQPFYATVDPDQSGLHITNSTIDSTTIGATTPSTGVFTNVSTTTGTISTAPTGNNDITNKQYVDAIAQGLNPKQAVKCATTANITLSGLQTIDTYTTLAGDRVLVKNQSTDSQNGIYIAGASAWTRATDMDVWSEVPGAYTVILNGSANINTGWVSNSTDTGTIGVTPITFVQFSGTGTYYAGTGLTLGANTFSITDTGVTAATKGSASKTVTAAVNAQGQLTSLTDQDIAISNTQVSGLGTMSTQNAGSVAITGGSLDGVTIGGSVAGAVTGTTITATTFNGAGTGLTGTASGLSIGGNAATATTAGSATTATTATNLAGGAAGSVPYQASSGTTSMLAAGTNGQVLTLSSGVPVWNTPTVGTVTSVSGTGTVSGISLSGTVTSSGNLTLGGSLDLSSPPVIGGTTPNTITGSTINADTKVVSPDYYAQSILGGNLRTSGGTSLLNWDGGGSGNITVNGGLLANPSNKNISLAPTGTGTVTINPATASAMDNVAIGGTTPLAGTFTNLRFNTNLSINGSTGTIGQVLTSNGSGLPTWTTPASAITISDDTTTNATRYPLFSSATTGEISTEYVSSTKYQFNPSTGVLTSTSFTGAGTGLTGTASSLSIGGNAATATSATTATNLAGGAAGSLPYQASAGSTSLLAAGSDGQILTLASGVPSWAAAPVTGIAITDDTTTNATRYLTFTDATTGSITGENVSSTKLQFNPSTGALNATDFVGTIGATTPAAGTFTTLTATGQTSLGANASNNNTLIASAGSGAFPTLTVDHISGASRITAANTSGNSSIVVRSSGSTGSIQFQTNGGSYAEQMRVSNTSSAVNYVQVTGSATGGAPVISMQGSDANIKAIYRSKGTGSESAHIFQNSAGNWLLRVPNPTGTLVNYPQIFASVSGSGAGVSVEGSDTNIDLTLTPKGTGQTKSKVFNATNGIIANSQTVSADYTVATGDSAMSAGPVSVASGVTVTVSSGSRWVVL